MLANLEALAALAEAGTMTRAATRLRISQSAVSKRIAALADEVDAPVIERDGRRVKLTPAGHDLLARTRPLLAELRHALTSERAGSGGVLTIGVSESVLASWGAGALARARAAVPGLELAIGAHRSPVAIERVRAGEYVLALCAGATDTAELSAVAITREPMVVVPSELQPLRLDRRRPLAVLTIEPGSASWRSLKPALAALRRRRGLEMTVERTVQSFSCAVQMARAGFGHALVPRPLALAMGIAANKLVPLPGVVRPVGLVGRPRALARPLVAEFTAALVDAAEPAG